MKFPGKKKENSDKYIYLSTEIHTGIFENLNNKILLWEKEITHKQNKEIK